MSLDSSGELTLDAVLKKNVLDLRMICLAKNIDISTLMDKKDFVDALRPFCSDVQAAPVQNLQFEHVSQDAFAKNLAESPIVMKLVFLDVDGVLNNTKSKMIRYGNDCTCAMLEPDLVKRFVAFIEDTDARIVLSTSWRTDDDMKLHLLNCLTKAGLSPTYIVGQTGSFGNSTEQRAEEIVSWVEAQPRDSISSWVALDDFRLALPEHFVWCDPNVGFTSDAAKAARSILFAADVAPN